MLAPDCTLSLTKINYKIAILNTLNYTTFGCSNPILELLVLLLALGFTNLLHYNMLGNLRRYTTKIIRRRQLFLDVATYIDRGLSNLRLFQRNLVRRLSIIRYNLTITVQQNSTSTAVNHCTNIVLATILATTSLTHCCLHSLKNFLLVDTLLPRNSVGNKEHISALKHKTTLPHYS